MGCPYDQCPSHMEICQLICASNQFSGFYMIGAVVVKGLRVTRPLKSEKNQNLFFQTLKRQKTNSRYYEARIQTKT